MEVIKKMLDKICRKLIYLRRDKISEICYINDGLKDIEKLPYVKLTKAEKLAIKMYCKEHKFVPIYHYYEVLKGNGLEPNPEYISWNNWCKRVLPKYNDIVSSSVFDDKNMYDLYFKDVANMPRTLIRKMSGGTLLNANYEFVDEKTAISILKNCDGFVVKRSKNSSCGSGVYKMDSVLIL